MLTITWIYQRPNNSVPFYYQSNAGANANQLEFDNLRINSGYVAGFEKFESDDGLSYTTIWKYNSIEDYSNFRILIATSCPYHVSDRNDYVINNNHLITATASEPVFFVNDSLSTFFTIGYPMP